MQRKALTIAVAAALTAVAGSASAALSFGTAAGQYNSTNTTVVYISGSSATNAQTKSWAETVFCQANTTSPVADNQVTWSKSSNEFAVVCKPKATFTGYSKTYVAIVKNSNGGSGNGVVQLLTPGLNYVNVFQANPATGALETTARKSNLGVADEEDKVLVKAGAITLPAGITLSQIDSDLDFTALNVVTFGTPVTLGLYHALVDSQILSGKINNAGNICRNGTTYSYIESCMPSLSQSQISSIFGGNLLGWKEIFNQPGDPIPTDDTVYVARRVVTSGTQTAARVHFLNDPCADNMVTFVAGNLTRLTAGTPVAETSTQADACNDLSADYAATGTSVFEGSGSGNVATCLTNHQRNNRWAIGINSLELPSTTDTSPLYTAGGGAVVTPAATVLNSTTQRHIKIEGFAPTTFNTATGRYRFWFEAVMYFPATISGDVLVLKNHLDTGFNDETVLFTLNNSFNTTVLLGAGKSAGILAPATTSNPPTPFNGVGVGYATEANTTAKPEMYYSRSISGVGNSCQPAMSFHATGINP